jgi:hypothetical protein
LPPSPRTKPGAYPLETARFQWEEGYRRLRDRGDEDPAGRRLDGAVEAVRDGIGRRLGPTFTAADLADLYGRGTDWGVELAIEAGVGFGFDPQSVVDAAFFIHLRGATDFAGGRTVAIEDEEE